MRIALATLLALMTFTPISQASQRRVRVVIVPVSRPLVRVQAPAQVQPLPLPPKQSQTPTLPPPQNVIPPAPPTPLVAPQPVIPTRPPTIFEFAKSVKPLPGKYDVVLCHPYTGKPVRVCFELPPGCVKVVLRKKLFLYEIDFDYGKFEIELGFGCRGGVKVDFND